MFCGYLIVRRGQARTVRLEYVVPPNVLTWSRGHKYRLLIQHQPGSHPDGLGVSLIWGNRRASSWIVEHPTLDWAKTVDIGSYAVHPIPLPKEPPVIVAPGHLIEPHAYLSAPKP
jgi:hypothetical protein